MAKPHIDIDDFRLRPHLRPGWTERADLERQQATAFMQTYEAARADNRPRHAPTHQLIGEPAELRGIPALTRGVGGVIRGTDPLGETIRRNEQHTRRR